MLQLPFLWVNNSKRHFVCSQRSQLNQASIAYGSIFDNLLLDSSVSLLVFFTPSGSIYLLISQVNYLHIRSHQVLFGGNSNLDKYYYYPHCIGNRGTGRLNILSKALQLESERLGLSSVSLQSSLSSRLFVPEEEAYRRVTEETLKYYNLPFLKTPFFPCVFEIYFS